MTWSCRRPVQHPQIGHIARAKSGMSGPCASGTEADRLPRALCGRSGCIVAPGSRARYCEEDCTEAGNRLRGFAVACLDAPVIIKSVEIRNYKSIETANLKLGPVTVLIGENNVGKSSLLRAMYLAQYGSEFEPSEVRIGATAAEGTLVLDSEIHGAIARGFAQTGISDFRSLTGLQVHFRAPTASGDPRNTIISWATDGDGRGETALIRGRIAYWVPIPPVLMCSHSGRPARREKSSRA